MDAYRVTKEEQHAGNAVCNADLDKSVPSFFRGEITPDAAATLVHDILLAAGQARMIAEATAQAAIDARKPPPGSA